MHLIRTNETADYVLHLQMDTFNLENRAVYSCLTRVVPKQRNLDDAIIRRYHGLGRLIKNL